MTPLDLLGEWRLEREIDDRLAGERLHVGGTTTLAADGPDRVTWHEAGTLTRPGRPGVAVSRTLALVRRPEQWWVLFDHGGDFHPWSPGTWVDHPCGPDHYRGLVDLDHPPSWSVTWQVTGPAKDYTMRTRLTRLTR